MEHDFGPSDEETQAWQDSRYEALSEDPVFNRCKLVSFESRSAGMGRKRKPRDVQLLVIDKSYAFVVKNGEVKSRHNQITAIDVLATEILTDLPYSERSVEILLRRAEKISILERQTR
jgi:hypothetical protein